MLKFQRRKDEKTVIQFDRQKVLDILGADPASQIEISLTVVDLTATVATRAVEPSGFIRRVLREEQFEIVPPQGGSGTAPPKGGAK